MLLTIIEIAAFMAAAAIVGVALGWVLRGTLGREQAEISQLRTQLRQLKKANRESKAASKAESAAAKTAVAPTEPAKADAKKAEPEVKKAAPKPAEKAKAAPAAKAPAKKAVKKKAAARKTQAEREADQAAGRAAFAEVIERIGKGESQDKLTRIYGIGKKYESMLNELDMVSYAQIAKLRKADMRTLAAALGVLDDRIETEDWAGSARQLLKGAK